MKIDRHGRAEIFTQEEIQLLFSQALQSSRDRTLFGVCLFSGCRIREARTLLYMDVYNSSGMVRPKLLIRKGNTKGKLVTRAIPINPVEGNVGKWRYHDIRSFVFVITLSSNSSNNGSPKLINRSEGISSNTSG